MSTSYKAVCPVLLGVDRRRNTRLGVHTNTYTKDVHPLRRIDHATKQGSRELSSASGLPFYTLGFHSTHDGNTHQPSPKRVASLRVNTAANTISQALAALRDLATAAAAACSLASLLIRAFSLA